MQEGIVKGSLILFDQQLKRAPACEYAERKWLTAITQGEVHSQSVELLGTLDGQIIRGPTQLLIKKYPGERTAIALTGKCAGMICANVEEIDQFAKIIHMISNYDEMRSLDIRFIGIRYFFLNPFDITTSSFMAILQEKGIKVQAFDNDSDWFIKGMILLLRQSGHNIDDRQWLYNARQMEEKRKQKNI